MTQNINTRVACFVLALFLSSCKASHKASSIVSETLSSETSLASRVSENSLSQILSTLTLQADSIVLWMQSCNAETASVQSSQTTFRAQPALHSASKESTAQSALIPLKDRPQVAKILISGVKANIQHNEQHQSNTQSQDTISTMMSHQSSQHNKDLSITRARMRINILIFVLFALIMALLAAQLKRHLRK